MEPLDFPRVRELVAAYCRTPMGRELALAIQPFSDPVAVNAEYDRVYELAALEEEPPLGRIADVRAALVRAAQEAVLSGPELVAVREACAGIRECRHFLERRVKRTAAVRQLVERLHVLPNVEVELGTALEETGEVRDEASPLLAQTRREMRRRRNRLIEWLEAMVAEHPDWYSDRPTVRHDRYVLALKVEARDKLPAVIHESSGTGHTLFVEPMETVAEQNELAELRGLEMEEVGRILRRLSSLVAGYADELQEALTAIGELDLLLAKSRYGKAFDCCRPVVSTDGSLKLVAGRHPLLAARKKDVVPLYFQLPEGTYVVLISGPNAGGKTVAIKTLGILCLMLSCGIPVPAAAGTCLPFFSRVFADIGDEQSLDDGLSSFTGHVSRLKEILEQADRHHLVLLDEIGASTSPEEGAALAMAVLEMLRDRQVVTVATSHFGVLKLFVQNEAGMVNAAMGFAQGKPTFQLTFGFPGESSALEIAAAAGLPAELISRAELRLGQEWLDMNAKLRALETELEEARRARQTAEEEKRRAAELRRDYEAKQEEWQRWREKERAQLEAERRDMLVAARREIENLVRQIKESQAAHESVVRAKRFVEQSLSQVQIPTANIPKKERPAYSVGETVRSNSLGKRGVITEVGTDTVTVAFGSIKMQLKPEDLEKDMSANAGNVTDGRHEVVREAATGFDSRLQLLGMSREEAAEALERFLDEAVSLGVKQVWLVHGKGTGVLRRMVRETLRRDPRIDTFRLGEPAEGGDGVTVVTMKAGVADELPIRRGNSG